MTEYRLPPAIETALHSIAARAKDAVGKCDYAGVTLMEAGRVTGRGSTDDVASEMDGVQSESGEGPSLDALRFLQIFNVASIPEGDDWPAFRRLAETKGVLSSLSVPLCRGGRAMGTINLYSRAPDGFSDCEHLAANVAAYAAAALAEVVQPHA